MKIAIAGTGYVGLSNADISKAKRMVGYTTTHDIYRGMQEAINWYIENIGSKEK
jgi:nucleoside-diphosphate-sugar epimerase